MEQFIQLLMNINEPKLFILCGAFIFTDVLTGYLKAFKNRKVNSSISRDGYIKKLSWLIAFILGGIVDYIINSQLFFKRKETYYYCDTYKKTKKCSKHYITEKEINNAVINTFNNYVNLLCEIEEKIDETISNSKLDYELEIKKIKLVELNKDISKYEKLLDSLLKDYELDYVSKEDYEMYKSDYLSELNLLKMKKDYITTNNINGFDYDWINEFKKNKSISKITRNIIIEFIDNIFIDDNRNIKIVFKYKDRFEEVIKFLKTHNSVI